MQAGGRLKGLMLAVLVAAAVLLLPRLGPAGAPAGPVVLGATTASGAEPLGAPDPEVLKVCRAQADARATLTRYSAEFLDVSIDLAATSSIRSEAKHTIHGYRVHHEVDRETYVAGQCESRCWQVGLFPRGRSETWVHEAWNGSAGYAEIFSLDPPGPPEFITVGDPRKIGLLAPDVLQVDLQQPWDLHRLSERMSSAPSRHLGSETLRGLVCDKLEFAEVAPGFDDGPCRTTRWLCPARDYREVRMEQVRDGREWETPLGVVVRLRIIRVVDRFLERDGHWYPAGYRQECWSELKDGRQVLDSRWLRVVTELDTSAEAAQLAFGSTLAPPGVRVNKPGEGIGRIDTRVRFDSLERALRKGAWAAAAAELTEQSASD